jgi:hypothetical protein
MKEAELSFWIYLLLASLRLQFLKVEQKCCDLIKVSCGISLSTSEEQCRLEGGKCRFRVGWWQRWCYSSPIARPKSKRITPDSSWHSRTAVCQCVSSPSSAFPRSGSIFKSNSLSEYPACTKKYQSSLILAHGTTPDLQSLGVVTGKARGVKGKSEVQRGVAGALACASALPRGPFHVLDGSALRRLKMSPVRGCRAMAFAISAEVPATAATCSVDQVVSIAPWDRSPMTIGERTSQ